MKNLKLHHLLIAGSLCLASCASVGYLGDKYDATTKTDIYYDPKDVKQDYKVIGHFSTDYNSAMKESYYKNKLTEKAMSIGADGVIILQTTGNADHEMVRADAIKYSKQAGK